jgi:hypothetical protein
MTAWSAKTPNCAWGNLEDLGVHIGVRWGESVAKRGRKLDENGGEISENGGIQPQHISRLLFFDIFCKGM